MENEKIYKMHSVELSLGVRIPSKLLSNYVSRSIQYVYSQEEIMQSIDFAPPFLKITKMIVFAGAENTVTGSVSICTGTITTEDTKGHYNESIYLAMCGLLMGSAASTHLAILFPTTAPQVIEVDYIRPTKDTTLWKPNEKGSSFFIECTIVNKKMFLVIANVRIFFGDISMGEVDKLKLMLTPRDSILKIPPLPEWK